MRGLYKTFTLNLIKFLKIIYKIVLKQKLQNLFFLLIKTKLSLLKV